jgi:hypothetical protein
MENNVGGVAQVVEGLSSKDEALISNPSTAKGEKKENYENSKVVSSVVYIDIEMHDMVI